MSEHLERFDAMLDPKQQTWDLSPNDIAAIRWAKAEIERLTREPCVWRYDDTHYKHDTSCGHAWQFMDDGVKENGVQYCPFCGGEIQENTGGE